MDEYLSTDHLVAMLRDAQLAVAQNRWLERKMDVRINRVYEEWLRANQSLRQSGATKRVKAHKPRAREMG